MHVWERVKGSCQTDPITDPKTRPGTHDLDPAITPISDHHFGKSLVPIWSLEVDRHSPAILTAENQPERRWSKLEPATVSLYSAGIFASFGWHHRLDPHDSLFHFRPSMGTESHCFTVGRLLEFMPAELDSSVVAARWSSPPVPLNSAWLELSDLSFPASVDQILATVDR